MTSPHEVVRVGISDLNIAEAPQTIRTLGLGSCVGIVIYDVSRKIGGMAHIMLPDSKIAKDKKVNTYKFADTAIPILVDKLLAKGARKTALRAKVSGGAQMFQFTTGSDVMRIGPRNVKAVEENLKLAGIPIVASEVGGNSGRTIEFDPSTGLLNVRTVNKGEKNI